MIRFLKYLLLGIFLSLGPVFWFPVIGKILMVKVCIFSLVAVLFFRELAQSRKRFLVLFLILGCQNVRNFPEIIEQ